MSPKKTNKTLWSRISPWLFTIVSIAFSAWFFFNRQYVVDIVHYLQYRPSSSVSAIAKNTTMTDKGTFYFYTSKPELDDSKTFNKSCQRKEANSPILGCYTSQRIYIYNVTNEKLDGMEEVTAAHETLHAIYERLSTDEKDKLKTEIDAAYKRVKTPELQDRMQYYQKNEPGEETNELYAILGTEFANLGPSLEAHYAKYFSDRQKIVRYNNKTQSIFTRLTNQAKSISDQINSLVETINADTKQYNNDSAELTTEIAAFNTRAKRTNGFSSQSEFDSARSSLLAKVNALNSTRDRIEANIAVYKKLRTQLEAIAAESDALNKSIDSTLAPAATF